MMNEDIERVLYSHEDLVAACHKVGKQIEQDYEGKTPILIGLLNGCIPFFAELIKHIEIPMQTEFMQVKSYFGGTESSGKVKIISNINFPIEGRDVIVCDDILDTGRTLVQIKNMLLAQGANSVKICCMLNKVDAHKDLNLTIDYVALEVENQFVVGFGLDYNELYRNLPYVGILKEEIYKK